MIKRWLYRLGAELLARTTRTTPVRMRRRERTIPPYL